MRKPGSATRWIVSAVIGLAIAAASALLYWFDPNGYGFYPICLFHRATGLLCPGCGALRATHQLLHGNLSAAFQFNPMLVTALALLAIGAGVVVIASWLGKPVTFRVSRKWLLLFAAVGLAVSLWRNIPGSPFFIPFAGGPSGHW
jgi:hypothetical protein